MTVLMNPNVALFTTDENSFIAEKLAAMRESVRQMNEAVGNLRDRKSKPRVDNGQRGLQLLDEAIAANVDLIKIHLKHIEQTAEDLAKQFPQLNDLFQAIAMVNESYKNAEKAIE